jgi:CYTH domain-containing protein
MATEIERKFLVSDLPAATTLGTGSALRQGYLAEEEGVEVRLRLADGTATLTIKAGRGRARTEVETGLDPAQAEDLWPHTEGRRIEKTRYRVPLGAVTAEVDVYGDALAGLQVVEVEFPSEAEADGFAPPAWFGRELTGTDGWSNAALARHGLPS